MLCFCYIACDVSITLAEQTSTIKKTLNLNEVVKIQKFVSSASIQNYDIDVISGRYIIDAKSIMGIFSLDLSRPINILIHADEAEAKDFLDVIKNFEV